MNSIILRGKLQNIQPSHTIKDVEYDKAELLVMRNDGKEDLLNIKFKKFSNPHKEGDTISLTGNLRSFSHTQNNKNNVDIHVFTYFDCPSNTNANNEVEIDGYICKKDQLRKTRGGKDYTHFILANNIEKSNGRIISNYIPCVLWGKTAKYCDTLAIGSHVKLWGALHSREYKKYAPNSDEFELRVAYELSVNKLEVLEDE